MKTENWGNIYSAEWIYEPLSCSGTSHSLPREVIDSNVKTEISQSEDSIEDIDQSEDGIEDIDQSEATTR